MRDTEIASRLPTTKMRVDSPLEKPDESLTFANLSCRARKRIIEGKLPLGGSG
jgi:hypothetical protein